jgi:hypothetical protein
VAFAVGLEAVAVVLDFLGCGALMSSSEAFRFVAVVVVGAALDLAAAVFGAGLGCLVDAVGVLSVTRAFLTLGSFSGSSDLRFVALGLLIFAWVVARLSGDLRARFEARVGAGVAPDSATFLRGMFTVVRAARLRFVRVYLSRVESLQMCDRKIGGEGVGSTNLGGWLKFESW